MAVNVLNQDGTTRQADEAPIQVFGNLTQMRAFLTADVSNWTKGQALAVLLGSTSQFDTTAQGLFAWNPASSAGDNGTTIIKPTNVTTGRWIKISG